MLLFVFASYFTVFVVGVLILLLFTEAGATSKEVRTPGAGLYIAGGIALIFLAVRLRRPRSKGHSNQAGHSRTERYLESRWGILVLAVVLYVVPSPIFIGGVKAVVDTHTSTAQQLAYLAQMLLIMLWLIEVPILMLLLTRERGVVVLERINSWFASHGRVLAVAASAGIGAYLLIVGLVEATG